MGFQCLRIWGFSLSEYRSRGSEVRALDFGICEPNVGRFFAFPTHVFGKSSSRRVDVSSALHAATGQREQDRHSDAIVRAVG